MQLKQDCVCEIDSVSKKFSHNLKSALKYGAKDMVSAAFGKSVNHDDLRKGEFWAVNNVSFDLKPGEGLGLMGLNGSGKSTLLKMINGIYLPNQGEIRIRGKVGALIEVSAGFHPNLTGRQNIYAKGALMGLRKEEIDELYESIVEFADIGRFINSPVKMYSSGMYIRLGFSVAVNITPDILLVDEVLAVGDFKFRQKCLSKINELRSKMAVILVSHNINDIILFCNRAIVLNQGKKGFQGSPKEAVQYYHEEVEAGDKKNAKVQQKKQPRNKGIVTYPFVNKMVHVEEKITDVTHRWVDETGNPVDSIKHRHYLALAFSFRLQYKPKNLVIGVPIWTLEGNYITAVTTDMADASIKIGDNGTVCGKLVFNSSIFNPDKYISVIAISDQREFIYRNLNDEFEIKPVGRYFGFITANHEWQFVEDNG